jgi:hypothetical protein
MAYSRYRCLALATAGRARPDESADPTPERGDALQPVLDRLRQLVERCGGRPVTPAPAAAFANDLQQLVRQLGQAVRQGTYNHLEPAAVPDLPPQVPYPSSPFRRLAQKSPQAVSTRFGTITRYRLG